MGCEPRKEKEENSGAVGLALSGTAGKSGPKPCVLDGRPEWAAHSVD
jgi:hypothetical protein